MLTLFCLLAGAFGVKLAWHKATRGTSVCWIGIEFEINLSEQVIRVSITAKYAADLRDELLEIRSLRFVGLKRLRRLAGRLSWAAGIVPRCRWVVSIFYAVVTEVERASKDGTEMRRAAKRADNRAKRGISRLGLALQWAGHFWQENQLWKRQMALVPAVSPLTPVVDASPWGIGGMLLGADGAVI